MYIITYRTPLGTYYLLERESLEEAKELAVEIFQKGHREVKLSQEIPMKVKIEF